MALIGQIRKNSWIMVVLVGLGLGGFIIMDMTNAGGGGGAADFTVGEVNGEKIPWEKFQYAENVLYQNSSAEVFGRRDYLWNYFVEKQIIDTEAEILGLNVPAAEMDELQFGARLSPVVQRNFTDPQTNQVDRQNLNEFQTALNNNTLTPQYQQFWQMQGEEVEKDRLQTKLNTIVKKAIYTPTWMAEQAQEAMNSSMNFSYVKVPFTEIEDDAVTLTDADFQAYLDENKAVFKVNEEIRTVDFIQYDVVATAEDSANLEAVIRDLIPAFTETEDDSLFVENNYGSIDVTYFTAEQIPAAIVDTVFDLAPGTVYGPYIDNGAYNAVKVLDKKTIPDSVKARHILVRVDTPERFPFAQAKIDSVRNLIESGAEPFDSLAIKVSEDLGSGAKGGDLPYAQMGMMVKPFNDMIFFQAEEGELNVVYTQFGIHLIEVTGRKFINNNEGVQMAFISEPIIPSEETQELKYDEVLTFISTNRTIDAVNKALEGNSEIEIETAEGIKKNAYIFSTLGTGQTSRDIIKWAHNPSTKIGEVAPEVFTYEDAALYYNSKYVVAMLKRITPAGVPTIDDVRNTIRTSVMNRKKGEMLKEQINSQDLDAIASQFETEVDTLQNVNFNMSYLQNIGQEPDVLAHLDAMEVNEVAGPVVGNNGVYIFKLLNKNAASLPTDIATLRNQAALPVQNAVDFSLIDALKKAAKIEDNRYTYY